MKIIDIIREEISEFNTTKFNPVEDIDIKRRFYNRQFSEAVNESYLKEFIGKSGRKYIIQKTINQDVFRVFDADAVKDRNRTDYLKAIGFAAFDDQQDFFTGYEHSQSIWVEPEYRRDGIAKAMTDFAENIYKKPYKPSNLLSPEMQGFVDNRFSQ